MNGDGRLRRVLGQLELARDAAELAGDDHIREGLDEAIEIVRGEMDASRRGWQDSPACTGAPDLCGAPAGRPCQPGCPSLATDESEAGR